MCWIILCRYKLFAAIKPLNELCYDKMGPNSSKLFISHGKHDDFIYQWNASERNDLFQWLAGLGFDL